MLAADQGDSEKILVLLQHGADINARLHFSGT
jgi:hypothetical protein